MEAKKQWISPEITEIEINNGVGTGLDAGSKS
jgi:hypothetical protein